jgi:hypothetical protein
MPTCELSEMLFPVEKTLVREKLNLGSISTTEYGIFATIDNETVLLNTCSSNYELVHNNDIFGKVENILRDAKIDFEVEYGMQQYSRFYCNYKIKQGGVSIGNPDDLIFPILHIEHSYNGLWKYKMNFGYFRMICTNGLVVPLKGKEDSTINISGKHTAKILNSLDQLVEKIQFFTNNNETFTKRFVEVSERWVENWADRVQVIIDATGIATKGYEHISEIIKKESHQLYNGKVNDWVIYNGINHYIFNATTQSGKPFETAINLRMDADKKVWETIYDFPNTSELRNKHPKKQAVLVVETI